MCGICAFIFKHADKSCDFERKLLNDTSALNRRGPDAHSHQLCNVGRDVQALFYGAVLHFRGRLTSQPLQGSETGNVLLWNGEIFRGIEVTAKENDGQILLNRLSTCQSNCDILSAFGKIQGPWAAIFWQASQNKLWFGRDVFGRRSLLVHVSSDGESLGLSSVRLKQFEPWQEVPASGLYCLKFSETDIISSPRFSEVALYPWVYAEPHQTSGVVSLSEARLFSEKLTLDVFRALKNVTTTIEKFGVECHIPVLNSALPEVTEKEEKGKISDFSGELLHWASAEQLRLAEELLKVLGEAVRVRVECQSHFCSWCITAVLNSASSTERTFAPLLRRCTDDPATDQCNDCMFLMSEEACELANNCVSCATFDTRVDAFRDHISAASVNGETKTSDTFFCDFCQRRKCHGDNCDRKLSQCNEFETADARQCSDCHCRSRHCRQSPSTRGCSNDCCNIESCTCVQSEKIESTKWVDEQCGSSDASGSERSSVCPHTKVAVLFSGGVDSLVIAALADKFVPPNEPIDLLNVAFEQVKLKGKNSGQSLFDVPDRVTGQQGLRELQTINPHRKWNFVEINISLEELQAARDERIRDLVYPLNTVLDDSIGCAVWFAARGRGVLRSEAGNETSYTSPARVVLVGMGADEQLGGYSRHRVRFNEGGWIGLIDELQMEIRRISSRNLGRDDRVISDHSREARLPFLDENVVRFLSSLPIHVKADLSLPRGIGEKFLLRLAAFQLGLRKGALLQKRAIQFGSRIAKAENHREKANAVCDRLLQTATIGACPEG